MTAEEIIDKNSFTPIYHQLYKYFETQIRNGDLKPGDTLPTEMELADRFDISRMTVRKAIYELISAGMVYTHQGKGTFVAKPALDNNIFDLNNFYHEIGQKGIKPCSELLEARVIKADDKLAKRLGIAVNTRCLFFRVVISAGGEPLIYETRYTVYTKRPPILESELKDLSLVNLAEAHSATVPLRSNKVLMVSNSNEEESKVLCVEPGTPVFLLIQTIYNTDNEIIAWGKSIYRGDKYKLVSNEGWGSEDKKNR